mgnify:CR=1 FL=1
MFLQWVSCNPQESVAWTDPGIPLSELCPRPLEIREAWDLLR